jgi:hypothetical protein
MARTLAEAEAEITRLEKELATLKSAVSLWRDSRSWEEGCQRAKLVRQLLGEPEPPPMVRQ